MIWRLLLFIATLTPLTAQEATIQTLESPAQQASNLPQVLEVWLPALEAKSAGDSAFDTELVATWKQIQQASVKNNAPSEVQKILRTVAGSLEQWSSKWETAARRVTSENERNKSTLQRADEFERQKEMQIENIERAYRRDVEPAQKQAYAAIAALIHIAKTSPDVLAGLGLEDLSGTLAAQTKRDTLLENARPLDIEVMQVLKDGAIVDLLRSSPGPTSSLSSVGGGGVVLVDYSRSGKLAFVEGLRDVVEGDRPEVLAARDGSHTYTDVQGASRTIARYVLIQ